MTNAQMICGLHRFVKSDEDRTRNSAISKNPQISAAAKVPVAACPTSSAALAASDRADRWHAAMYPRSLHTGAMATAPTTRSCAGSRSGRPVARRAMYPRSLHTGATTAVPIARPRRFSILDRPRRNAAGAQHHHHDLGGRAALAGHDVDRRLPASAAGAACGCRSLTRAAARVTSA